MNGEDRVLALLAARYIIVLEAQVQALIRENEELRAKLGPQEVKPTAASDEVGIT